MNIQSILTEKNLAILSIILAIAFGSFSIYANYAENPEITFDVINDANVLDVHKPLSGLDIYYQGEDIQQKNQNLRIVSIKVENTGNVDILQSFYDKNVLWGLDVENGHVIEARLIGVSSNYLLDNLNVSYNDNTIEFQKVIFDQNEYFVVEILILHDKEIDPAFRVLGKIAGIEQINLKESYQEDKSFLEEVFDGSIFVQLVRIVVYMLILLFLLIAIVIVQKIVADIRNSRFKSKKREVINNINSLNINNKEIIKNILFCTPRKEWQNMFDLLKIHMFEQDILKNVPKDYFDRYSDKLSVFKEFNDIEFLFSDSFTDGILDETMFATMENTIIAIGSYLNEKRLLYQNIDSDGTIFFKVKNDFLAELKDAIDYLQITH